MKTVEVYQAIGRSLRNKVASSGFWSNAKGALREFVKENPRFHGSIQLRKQMGIKGEYYITTEESQWVVVEKFEKSKEILDWYLFEGEGTI